MENIRNTSGLAEIGGDARRQYIDAQATFVAWESAGKAAAEVRGGMYWKLQAGTEYLIRTSPRNTQKSLGPRSAENEAIHEKFIARKAQAEERVTALAEMLVRHQRMNRALFVGRAPVILVNILNALARAGIADHFTVVGTHALYAYEAAAGVRFDPPDAMATRDVDLLWDTRKRISFVTRMKLLGSSMLGLLKKVDPSFEIRPDRRYTAVNSNGFEVDIIRRMAEDNDPHPLQVTESEDEFWAVQAQNAGVLLNAPQFSAMIVSPSGYMARMDTVSPVVFASFKRWQAVQPNRDALKRTRDVLQATLVERLVTEYLPQLMSGDPNTKVSP